MVHLADQIRWSDLGEVGFLSGIRILFWLYRHAKWIFVLILQPVLLYFYLTNRVAREASLDYLKRLDDTGTAGTDVAPTARNVYRHISVFAHSTLDKLAIWASPESFANLEFHSRQLLLDQIATGRGGVLLGAHLGNMEICHHLSNKNEMMKLNILVHTKHADKFNTMLRELNAEDKVELIEVSDLSPATAIRLTECVNRGEFVAILADRTPVSSTGRSQAVDFLGAPALFPEGPFILASLLKCPVYTLFCIKEEKSYVIRCEKFAEQILLPRNDRQSALTSYMQRFACILEKNLRKAPMQWFNFYPFWNVKP